MGKVRNFMYGNFVGALLGVMSAFALTGLAGVITFRSDYVNKRILNSTEVPAIVREYGSNLEDVAKSLDPSGNSLELFNSGYYFVKHNPRKGMVVYDPIKTKEFHKNRIEESKLTIKAAERALELREDFDTYENAMSLQEVKDYNSAIGVKRAKVVGGTAALAFLSIASLYAVDSTKWERGRKKDE